MAGWCPWGRRWEVVSLVDGGDVEVVDVFWRRKVNKAHAGSNSAGGDEVVRAAFVWGQNSPEARTMSLAFTIKKR